MANSYSEQPVQDNQNGETDVPEDLETQISPETTLKKTRGRLVFLFIAFFIAYALVMGIFNVSPRRIGELIASLPLFHLLLLALRLAAMLLAEVILWHCYLLHLGVRIPFSASFSIFMAGFFAGIIPGRVGELIRYYLLKQRFGIPMSRTLPIHVLYTLNAGVAAVLMALPALYLVYPRKEVVVGALVLLFVILFALRTAVARKVVIALARRTPIIKRHVEKLDRLIESTCHLTKPSVFVWALPLSIFYLITMAAIYPILIDGFGFEQNIVLSMATYCVAAITGALTLLPGGVGTFELSGAGLLTQIAIPGDHAASVAILSSALTAWPGIFIGFIFFLLNKRYLLPQKKDDGIQFSDTEGS
ncbi:MAG: lysylphosphatidylglycerol synthase transmembrane domain-containing protein [bacterium]|nr:lysylphosphatidylglycerol synthase transmembrane domain-containing protein [bacterium]